VSAETSLELVKCDGVDVHMGIAVRLPPVGCCPIELVRSKNDFLAIRALGDHEFLFNPLESIFCFHGVIGVGECDRASSQEFPKSGMRWWRWWMVLLLSLVVRLELVQGLEHGLHQLVVVGIVGLTIVGVVPRVHHLMVW
jgi:hypothetical protein